MLLDLLDHIRICDDLIPTVQYLLQPLLLSLLLLLLRNLLPERYGEALLEVL